MGNPSTAGGKRPLRQAIRCDIVRVASPEFLIDPYQRACRYETADGMPLELGYYLALWPARANRGHYGRELHYVGPLPTLAAARLLKTSAYDLGLVAQPAQEVRPAAAQPPFALPAVRPAPYLQPWHTCSAG